MLGDVGRLLIELLGCALQLDLEGVDGVREVGDELECFPLFPGERCALSQ